MHFGPVKNAQTALHGQTNNGRILNILNLYGVGEIRKRARPHALPPDGNDIHSFFLKLQNPRKSPRHSAIFPIFMNSFYRLTDHERQSTPRPPLSVCGSFYFSSPDYISAESHGFSCSVCFTIGTAATIGADTCSWRK